MYTDIEYKPIIEMRASLSYIEKKFSHFVFITSNLTPLENMKMLQFAHCAMATWPDIGKANNTLGTGPEINISKISANRNSASVWNDKSQAK